MIRLDKRSFSKWLSTECDPMHPFAVGSGSGCPLALYLRDRGLKYPLVTVDQISGVEGGCEVIRGHLPRWVLEFIERVDGDYETEITAESALSILSAL